MIKLKTCESCGKEFDSILESCPHCNFMSYTKKFPEEQGGGSHQDESPAKKNWPNTFVTISEKYVHVDEDLAKSHPLFGLNGGLKIFRICLYTVPMCGILYTLVTDTEKFGTSSFWLFFCLGLDSLFFIWGHWLSRFLKNFTEKTTYNIYKYLCILCLVGVFSAYIGYKINPVIITGVDSPVFVLLAKNTIFSVFFLFYFNLSYRVKVTYFKFVRSTDSFLIENHIDISNLPREDTWVAYAETFAKLTKNTNPSDFRGWVSNTDRGAPENVAKVKSAGDVDVEKFSLRIAALKNALNNGLITEDDYTTKKKQILDEL